MVAVVVVMVVVVVGMVVTVVAVVMAVVVMAASTTVAAARELRKVTDADEPKRGDILLHPARKHPISPRPAAVGVTVAPETTATRRHGPRLARAREQDSITIITDGEMLLSGRRRAMMKKRRTLPLPFREEASVVAAAGMGAKAVELSKSPLAYYGDTGGSGIRP